MPVKWGSALVNVADDQNGSLVRDCLHERLHQQHASACGTRFDHWPQRANGSSAVRRRELVGLQPDIICTATTPAVLALQRETRTIPIVYAGAGDPVASGIVPRHLNTRSLLLIFVSIVLSFIPHDMMYGPRAALIAESFTGRVRQNVDTWRENAATSTGKNRMA
jgi:hypothetical protein